MWYLGRTDGITTLAVSLLVEVLSLLALSVVLSSYERRSMSLLHNRDAPVAYLIAGLGQPVADGGKLLMKTTVYSMSTTNSIPGELVGT